MIQYRKADGTLGEVDTKNVHSIDISNNCFRITLITYGWDEYDYYFDYIDNIIDLRIGDND